MTKSNSSWTQYNIHVHVHLYYLLQPTRTDEVFRILLNNLDLESKIALRKVCVDTDTLVPIQTNVHTAMHSCPHSKCLIPSFPYPQSSSPMQAYMAHLSKYMHILGIYTARHVKVCCTCTHVHVHSVYIQTHKRMAENQNGLTHKPLVNPSCMTRGSSVNHKYLTRVYCIWSLMQLNAVNGRNLG